MIPVCDLCNNIGKTDYIKVGRDIYDVCPKCFDYCKFLKKECALEYKNKQNEELMYRLLTYSLAQKEEVVTNE